MARRQIRETALQILYELEVGKGEFQKILDRNTAQRKFSEENVDFLNTLVKGVKENVETLDEIISHLSTEWSINRLPYVDKNILRLALYEILYISDIPYNVSINEAVELGKTFGGIDSHKFINGILDNAVKYEGIAKNYK